MTDERNILFFDGHCNLCNAAVNFIIDRDKKHLFYFSALQSDFGKNSVAKNQIDETNSTFIYLENKKYYTKSTAALKVSRKLNGFWPLLYIFIIIPKFVRDALYVFVAKNRYRWFGKKEDCRLSETGLEQRFIER